MSSAPLFPSEPRVPGWFWDYLGQPGPWKGDCDIGGQAFIARKKV